jgi:hypothetical protein
MSAVEALTGGGGAAAVLAFEDEAVEFLGSCAEPDIEELEIEFGLAWLAALLPCEEEADDLDASLDGGLPELLLFTALPALSSTGTSLSLMPEEQADNKPASAKIQINFFTRFTPRFTV